MTKVAVAEKQPQARIGRSGLLLVGALLVFSSGLSASTVDASFKKARVALLDLPIRVDQGRGEHAAHGAAMVREIEAVCGSHCDWISVTLSESGRDLTARRYAEGVEKALKLQADVMVIPSGARAGLDSLAEKRLGRAIQRAWERGVPIVVAAGTGLQNPYRPEPLKTLIPQRFRHVWVVAAAGETLFEDETLRGAQNFGPELQFRALAPSSSVAAAQLGAWVARVMNGMHPLQKPKALPSLLKKVRARFGAHVPGGPHLRVPRAGEQ
jgi:hypothetical protein